MAKLNFSLCAHLDLNLSPLVILKRAVSWYIGCFLFIEQNLLTLPHFPSRLVSVGPDTAVIEIFQARLRNIQGASAYISRSVPDFSAVKSRLVQYSIITFLSGVCTNGTDSIRLELKWKKGGSEIQLKKRNWLFELSIAVPSSSQ